MRHVTEPAFDTRSATAIASDIQQVEGLGFTVEGYHPPIMENQMENEMKTGNI